MVKANELNSVALAYIGDAVYELHVRRFLIEARQRETESNCIN